MIFVNASDIFPRYRTGVIIKGDLKGDLVQKELANM
ncbi:hypothetical protein Sulac_1726 [Sulfobacillus acidophilus DSM 10332]|uniref:Uncharacterized protein n=1 Tax=Sulfobacillus acidophilus (strain ATCC 700253 / DSM 10332 / NAL) TaxID=679936 RepID=G8TZI2_SULAD|nr:hypothetical protein Sulac_1726 [Sulfobacillus acidophilus DSM 10332]